MIDINNIDFAKWYGEYKGFVLIQFSKKNFFLVILQSFDYNDPAINENNSQLLWIAGEFSLFNNNVS